MWREAKEYQDFGKEVFWKRETKSKLFFSKEFLFREVDLTELFQGTITRNCCKFPPGFERHIL